MTIPCEVLKHGSEAEWKSWVAPLIVFTSLANRLLLSDQLRAGAQVTRVSLYILPPPTQSANKPVAPLCPSPP